jgi:hypothetical protein
MVARQIQLTFRQVGRGGGGHTYMKDADKKSALAIIHTFNRQTCYQKVPLLRFSKLTFTAVILIRSSMCTL